MLKSKLYKELHTPFQKSVLWSGEWKSLKYPEFANGSMEIYLHEPYMVKQVYITKINIKYKGVLNHNQTIDTEALVKVEIIPADDIIKEKTLIYTMESDLHNEYIKYFITNIDSNNIEGFYVCARMDDTGPFVLKQKH